MMMQFSMPADKNEQGAGWIHSVFLRECSLVPCVGGVQVRPEAVAHVLGMRLFPDGVSSDELLTV